MTPITSLKIFSVVLPFILASWTGKEHAPAPSKTINDSTGKQMYIPAKVYRIPENNDYNSNESEYSYKRMVQSDNIVIFWNKEFGDDPTTNPDPTKRFNAQDALKELERFYSF